MTGQPKILFLDREQLLEHPQNMRRVYPEVELGQMASSIVATNGLLHAMRVVRAEQRGKYLVVDGNKRLRAANRLNGNCPKLKCELVSESKARQLLNMVISNKMRSDPDPISEGLHYRRLIQEEGYTRKKIASETGVSAAHIAHCLSLLELDEPIQELIAAGRFTHDARAIKAIQAILNKNARVKLVQRLADTGASFRGIVGAANQLVASLKEKKTLAENAPSHVLAEKRTGRAAPQDGASTWQEVRKAAREMCDHCEVKLEALKNDAAEPAWTMISHAAEETCDGCNLKNIAGTCRECPGVDLLSRLISLSEVATREAVRTKGMKL